MKKIFTLAAAALITLSAAATEDPLAAYKLTADPAPGSTLPSLESVTISYSMDDYWGIIPNYQKMSVKKDGVDFCGVTGKVNDSDFVVTLATPATEPGVYTIEFAANTFNFANPEFPIGNGYIKEPITLTYTVGEETGSEDPLAPYKMIADPASGSKLAALAEVNISYSMDDYWGIIPNYQKMSVKKDGEDFCGVTGKVNDSDFIVRLATPATEPGVYTIEFAANTFNFANPDFPIGNGYIKEPITLTYYVGESQSGDEGLKIKSDPEVGVVTAPLSQVTLSYSFDDYATIELNEDGTAEVLKNGEPFCGVTITPDDDYDTNSGLLICRFATPITEPGTYTLLFGANSLDIYTETDYWQNDEELAFNYTVEGTTNPSDNYKWTMTPANGEQLNSLESVLLTYSFDELNEVMVTEVDKIQVMKDGQAFCGVTYAEADDYTNNLGGFRFTLKTPATEAGTYSIVFEKGSLSYQEIDSFFPMDLKDNLTYTYTVTGTPQPSGYKWTVNPADGKVVEKLDKIVITYSSLDYDDIDVNVLEDIAVYKDGSLFSNVTKASDTDSDPHTLTFTLKTPATEPGTYKFIIAKEAICFMTGGYSNFDDNEEEIVFTYTIEGDVEFAYTTNPASGDEIQAPFSDITFNYFNCGEGGLSDDLKGGITVTRNGEAYDASFTVTNNTADMNSVLSFVEPVTEEGTYTITLPSKMLYYFTDKTFTTVKYVPVTLTFNVTPAPQPVVYDLNPTKTNPANDATIDLAERDFNTIFIYVPNGVSTAADAKLTVTNEAGTYSNEVPLKFNYSGCLWATIPDAKENGVYTISVPQGAFGDADWQNNPEFGHANPAFTITVNLTGGAGADFDLNYISYTPAGAEATGLGEITITFPEGTQMAENASATLADGSMDYKETSSFTEVTAGSVFGLKFEPAPTSLSMYRLTIPMGTFGDAEFISSNGTKGHANPEITIDWILSGINVIEADGTVSQYFNLQGQPIAFPAKGQVVIKVTEGKATKIVY